VYALIAGYRGVQVVVSIAASQDRDECLVERHEEHPVQKKHHVSQKDHGILRIVPAVLEEEVHVEEEGYHGEKVKDAEYNKHPVEEDGPGVVNSANQSTVAAHLHYEAQEKLVLPVVALPLLSSNITYARFEKMPENLDKQNEYNAESKKQTYAEIKVNAYLWSSP
jgi:hypothetical protein